MIILPNALFGGFYNIFNCCWIHRIFIEFFFPFFSLSWFLTINIFRPSSLNMFHTSCVSSYSIGIDCMLWIFWNIWKNTKERISINVISTIFLLLLFNCCNNFWLNIWEKAFCIFSKLSSCFKISMLVLTHI